MKTTKDLAMVAMVAAIYCAITLVVSPIAFGPMQFRISEIMKPLALKGRKYIIGLTIGLFLANLISPYGGLMEWLWMPFMCFVGGEIAYLLRRFPIFSVIFYSVWISFAVSVLLQVVLGIPFYLSIGWIFVPETFLMLVGLPIMNKIWNKIKT